MGFLHCFIYLAIIGISFFIVGRLVPKDWFHEEKWPYRGFSFEKNGAVYQTFKIKKWQNRIPDMSKILPMVMPSKSFTLGEEERLPRMIQETCVAEWIHILLQIFGLGCIWVWPGTGGIIVAILYWILNIPFIMVQRYNRPRLIRMQQRAQKRKNG
jgi:glycosyl-4,4'-diaponeurosporenoate acyltransferase